MGLTWVKALCCFGILKIFVFSENIERMSGPLQPMMPLLRGQFNCQQLSIPYKLVLLSWCKFLGDVSHGVQFRVFSKPLELDGSYISF